MPASVFYWDCFYLEAHTTEHFSFRGAQTFQVWQTRSQNAW
jgi:hypothetical protein